MNIYSAIIHIIYGKYTVFFHPWSVNTIINISLSLSRKGRGS